jgi:acetyl-CoA C-acetyltransferase
VPEAVSQIDARTPVIVGAGQVTRDGADGPIALAVEALRLAAADAGAGDALIRKADSSRHVATLGWPYADEAALIAAELGSSPRETVRTVPIGGDGPQRLITATARAIADGEIEIALVTGAEAMAALRRKQQAGTRPDWPSQPSTATPTRVVGTDMFPSNAAEATVGLLAPVYNYALLETAVQARGGSGRDRHQTVIAELWSRFSAVAEGNPHARLRRRYEPAELIEATADNRPVSFPYLKRLTANLDVDQATGLIMCSAQAAAGAGVPRDRWVFPLAGAHAADEWFMSERADLAASPAIDAASRAALEHAGVTIDDVAYIDLYSCFPSAVQIAAAELGVVSTDERPLTLTGGLTFAGGPGNNYSSHSIATAVTRLRDDPDAFALTTALGWYVTKHACGIYSGQPGTRPFREIDAGDRKRAESARAATAEYEGTATIEAFTIPYDRAGEPEAAIISALTPEGSRVLQRTTDPELIGMLLSDDPLGEPLELPVAHGPQSQYT